MRRLIIVVVAIVVLLGALVGFSGYLLKGLVTGEKDTLLKELSRRAGVQISVERADFDVAGWYAMRPALSLTGVKVANPPGFQQPHLLTADRIDVRVAIKPLLSRRLEVETLVLEKPQFLIERNKQGISNLEVFSQGLGSGKAGGGPGKASGSAVAMSIQSMEIRNGEVRMAGGAVSRLHNIDLQLKDVTAGRPIPTELSAKVYEGTRSTLNFKGNMGPFSPNSGAVDGEADIKLSVADVPDAVRRLEFGDLLAKPGSNSIVTLSGTVKGDLYGALQSNGKFTIDGVSVGRPEHLLPLSGSAPLAVTVRKLMSTPVTDLRLRNALLKVGPGEWKGAVDLLMAGGVVRGKSTGAIRGIDINQFLAAFTSSDNRMAGQLNIPNYTLRFGGKDAEQIKRSLSGEGQVMVAKGQIKALDILASIRRAVEKVGLMEAEKSGNTEFTTLNTAVRIDGGALQASDFVIEGPALMVNGAGSIGFDQALQFKLSTLVRGRIAELLGRKGVGNAPAEAVVPVEVSGTVGNPRIVPNVKSMAVSTGVNFLRDLIQKRLAEKKQQ